MQRCTIMLIFALGSSLLLSGQNLAENNVPMTRNSSGASPVPYLVRFSSSMRELDGTILHGPSNMTFSLYKDQTGGIPLWSETQTVTVDDQGHFAILLGSASPLGVPASTFAAGEPRWIGIAPEDAAERPRIELVSVPYALEAANAQTLGGREPEEFVSQQQLNSMLTGSKLANATVPPVWLPAPGQSDRFEATSPNGPSFLSDATVGPPFQVKSESMVPHLNADLLHGLSDSAFAKLSQNNLFSEYQSFLGGIDMTANNPDATNSSAFDSAPLDFDSASTASNTRTALKQRFRWISQPPLGATASPLAQLSLLFAANGGIPTKTGLSINSDGTINFAPGQQFPTAAVMTAISGGQGSEGVGATGGTAIPIVNTESYSWQQAPQATAIRLGANIVTLKPCPKGVNGTDLWHYLYISGEGTPEVVLITGGTCTSKAKNGTIEFSALYQHRIGYTISSATDGVQEAVNDAVVTKTNGQVSRQVMIDPGSHLFRARLSIRGTGMTITSSGATITCSVSDTCIMLGDPSNSNTFESIVLSGIRVAAGVVKGTWTAVEDNAESSTIDNLVPVRSSTSGASLGHLIQIDNDQAATVSHLNVNPGSLWGRCDTSFCSSAIVGPGPYSTNAGVLTVEDSNISLQCLGNGIDNQDGNTTKISNSVIQGWAQFGIRGNTIFDPQTVNLVGVIEEEDGDCNPLGTGSAGLIVEGGQATVSGSTIAGYMPLFAATGSIEYWYYVVVHSSTLGTSPAYIAGYAMTSDVGTIPVVWNRIGTAGTISYDVLRIQGDGGADMQAPNGTGPYAVAVGVPATSCSSATCSILDSAAANPVQYTVSDNTFYWPSLKLWPGTVILTSANDTQNTGGGSPTMYFGDVVPNGPIVNSAGGTYPSVFATMCHTANLMSVWEDCAAGNSAGNDYPPVAATLLQLSNSGGSPGGLKGRLTFELPPGSSVGPTHVITLADSNVDKTLATSNHRPAWDPNDTYIGYDGGYDPSRTQMSMGAPVSISRYIANPGDGINYLERLTPQQEQFRVPVLLNLMTFSQLPNSSDGTVVYCSDCTNIADDGARFDSAAAAGGHGTTVLHENGQWRVH